MKYLVLAYDEQQSCFVSRAGPEKNVLLKPKKNSSYYLPTNKEFVVRLIDGWIAKEKCIGDVLSTTGELLSVIPNPGSEYGEFAINGLTAGNGAGFKLVIEPYGNSNNYFLYYNIKNKTFENVGNIVR